MAIETIHKIKMNASLSVPIINGNTPKQNNCIMELNNPIKKNSVCLLNTNGRLDRGEFKKLSINQIAIISE